jgi:hypothetical protein
MAQKARISIGIRKNALPMTRMPRDVDRLERLSYGDLPSSRGPRSDSLIRSPFVEGLPSLAGWKACPTGSAVRRPWSDSIRSPFVDGLPSLAGWKACPTGLPSAVRGPHSFIRSPFVDGPLLLTGRKACPTAIWIKTAIFLVHLTCPRLAPPNPDLQTTTRASVL